MPNKWVKVEVGDAPLVIAAPHGGHAKPDMIPRRSGPGVVIDGDLHTLELAERLAERFTQRTRRHMHVVICKLHRSRLDANREARTAALGDPDAHAAWDAYHRAIEQAAARVVQQWGRGLIVDLHGQGHPERWIEIGYTVRDVVLRRPDAELDAAKSSPLLTTASIAGLVRRRMQAGVAPSEVLRGASSLGGLLEAAGYSAIPSPRHPHAAGGHYFSGGYTSARHGSASQQREDVAQDVHTPIATAPGPIDAVQLELPLAVRDPASPARDAFCDVLCDVLLRFLATHYGHDHPGALL